MGGVLSRTRSLHRLVLKEKEKNGSTIKSCENWQASRNDCAEEAVPLELNYFINGLITEVLLQGNGYIDVWVKPI